MDDSYRFIISLRKLLRRTIVREKVSVHDSSLLPFLDTCPNSRTIWLKDLIPEQTPLRNQASLCTRQECLPNDWAFHGCTFVAVLALNPMKPAVYPSLGPNPLNVILLSGSTILAYDRCITHWEMLLAEYSQPVPLNGLYY